MLLTLFLSPISESGRKKKRTNKTREKRERIVKCHPYLWLAPHLPLVPCLNPQSACYIYIVVREFRSFSFFLLTKHFLFDCTHTKSRSLQIAARKFLGKIPADIFSVFHFFFSLVVCVIWHQISKIFLRCFCLFFSPFFHFLADLSILDVRKFMELFDVNKFVVSPKQKKMLCLACFSDTWLRAWNVHCHVDNWRNFAVCPSSKKPLNVQRL